jgi:phage shock protein PspC (stress-responsive transcriptional regulator)
MKWLPGADYFQENVVLRNDTLLGVCEALGQDLNFHPNFLRVPLATGIVIAPMLMVAIYLGLGALVFVSRTFFPDRTQTIAQTKSDPVVEADNEQVELPRAA